MCGIAGIYNLDPHASVSQDLVSKLCQTIVRRGPDDEGIYIGENVGLGMRRLSIIDVAGGHQPIANEDGSLRIVFNGEIFNHETLQAGLRRRGHQFTTRSDTETVLHLFEEEGPACLRHLRGMFAIAIWNARTRTLFLARDRLGIKPLHYFVDRQRLVFGSELKAVLAAPCVSRALDWTAVDAFFTYGYIPAPWTVYRSVKKLPAGYYLLADERGVAEHQYWDLSMGPKLQGTPADIEAEFVDRFRESVRMRLLSEVPLGAYLSGGVDSSMVAAMMAQSSDRPINTFTIGFGGRTGSFLDERPFAREVSMRYGTNHREFEVHADVEEALDATLGAFDEPFADDSVIPTHHICRLARQHVTVALTGLGGDENFGGYERYLGFRLSTFADRFPWRSLARSVRPLIGRLREEKGGHYRINHLKRFLEASDLAPALRWQRYNAIMPQHDRRAFYRAEIARDVDFDAVDLAGRQHFERCDAEDPLDRALYQDIKMYLPDDILALTDRLGMWHSLELRVPFIDHTLMEFCARIPTSLKLRRGEKKYLLRQAAKPFVPASVLDHRKQGFASPMAMWLRGDLRGVTGGSLDRRAIERAGVLDAGQVDARMTAHQERRQLNDKLIFAALMFQRWITRYQG
jgi:asparagine synthase (glutamine-hydrolysing)